MAGQSSWLAYQANNLEISGSSPLPAKELNLLQDIKMFKEIFDLDAKEVESR